MVTFLIKMKYREYITIFTRVHRAKPDIQKDYIKIFQVRLDLDILYNQRKL